MKIFFVFLFLMFLNSLLFSAPLEFIPISVTQPDGVTLSLFASGDEFYNWLHDKDFYTITRDSRTGYYVYASLENNKIVPTQLIVGRVNPAYSGLIPGIMIPPEEILKIRNDFFAKSPKDMGDAPKTGTINNLVIFIRFSDDPEFMEWNSYYRDIFNNDTSGRNSMFNYFKNVSYNALLVRSTFYPIPQGQTVISFQDSHPRNYYQPYDSLLNPIGYLSSEVASREHTLLKNAVEYISSQVPATLNIDGDNDGYVDNACFIIFGNPGVWGTILWPHRWSLYSYTVNINGKRVYDYNFHIQNRLYLMGNGTLCHEMTHTIGAPDLYHYSNMEFHPAIYGI